MNFLITFTVWANWNCYCLVFTAVFTHSNFQCRYICRYKCALICRHEVTSVEFSQVYSIFQTQAAFKVFCGTPVNLFSETLIVKYIQDALVSQLQTLFPNPIWGRFCSRAVSVWIREPVPRRGHPCPREREDRYSGSHLESVDLGTVLLITLGRN